MTYARLSWPILSVLGIGSLACGAGVAPAPQDGGGAGVDAADDGGCGPPPEIACFCGSLVCRSGRWSCSSCSEAGAPPGCNPPCAAGQICLGRQVLGGDPVPVDDAGACPAGMHPAGNHCDRDPTFGCVPAPSCSGAFGCSCPQAAGLCVANACNYRCVGGSASEIDCACDVP